MGRDVGGGGGSSVGRRGAAWTTLAVLGGQATRLTPWNGIEIRLSSFARYNLVRFASIPSSYFSAAAAAADSDAERRPRISRVKHTNTNTTHTRGRAKKQKKQTTKTGANYCFFFTPNSFATVWLQKTRSGGEGGGEECRRRWATRWVRARRPCGILFPASRGVAWPRGLAAAVSILKGHREGEGEGRGGNPRTRLDGVRGFPSFVPMMSPLMISFT